MENEICAINAELETKRDNAEKEITCRKMTLFCIKKYIETRELSFRYSNIPYYPTYTPLGDDIDKACTNKKKLFDECLSKFGLKFKSKTNVPNDYSCWDLNLCKLKE